MSGVTPAVAERIAFAKKLIKAKVKDGPTQMMERFGITRAVANHALHRARVGERAWRIEKRRRQAQRRARRFVEREGVPAGRSVEAKAKVLIERMPTASIHFVATVAGTSYANARAALAFARMTPEQREAVRQYHRSASAEWRAANPDRAAANMARWRAENAEYIRAWYRRYDAERRDRRAADGSDRERTHGPVRLADDLHTRIAALVPAGTPAWMADELVSTAYLFVLEDGVEAAEAMRRAKGELFERTTASRFTSASLDAVNDNGLAMIDLLEDDGALDAFDAVLDRIDRARVAA